MPRKRKRRANGEGAIIQLADGRFAAKIRVGHNENGKPIVRKKEAKTEKECQDWLTKVRHERMLGVNIAPSKTTLEQLLDRWLTDVVKHRCKPKTIGHYQDMSNHVRADSIGKVAIDKLTTPMIQRFLNTKAEEVDENEKPKLSRKTIKHIRDTMRAALNVAVDEWNLIPKNPARKASPGRVPKPEIRKLSVDESKKFIQAVEGHRWEALFLLAAGLGLRRGEVLGLRWCDIDTEKRLLRIAKSLDFIDGGFVLGDPKTSSSTSTLPLHAAAVTALKNRRTVQGKERLKAEESWIGNQWDLAFTTSVGTPIMPRNLKRAFDAVLKKAALGHIRFHDLRHSVVGILKCQGVPLPLISRYARHSSIKTTMDLYGGLGVDDLGPVTEAVEKVFPANGYGVGTVEAA